MVEQQCTVFACITSRIDNIVSVFPLIIRGLLVLIAVMCVICLVLISLIAAKNPTHHQSADESGGDGKDD